MNIQPTPIEFRRIIQAGDPDFIFKEFMDVLNVQTQDGRSTILHGFEQVQVNFYSLEGEATLEQFVTIPESNEPITQEYSGKIISFTYPYVFRKDNSKEAGFKIKSGKGVIQFLGMGLVSPTSEIILGM